MTTTKLYPMAGIAPLCIDAPTDPKDKRFRVKGMRALSRHTRKCRETVEALNGIVIDAWGIEEVNAWGDNLIAYYAKSVWSAKDLKRRRAKAAADPVYAENWKLTKNSPDGHLRKRARRDASIAQSTPAWADKKKMTAIRAEARRLTRETGLKHVVDHIVPLKGLDRNRNHIVCGLNNEFNTQPLPELENLRKWAWFDPDQLH